MKRVIENPEMSMYTWFVNSTAVIRACGTGGNRYDE
jgi:hypothetical protein